MTSLSSVLCATAALLLVNAPAVSARQCYYDRFGRYRCRSGLARGARIGLGVGIAILGLLILSMLLCLMRIRRRRALKRSGGLPPPVTGVHHEKPAQHQTNAYQPYPGGGADYPNQGGYSAPNYPVDGPQFPAPTHQTGGGYAPPSGPPPTHYAPPAGPPPKHICQYRPSNTLGFRYISSTNETLKPASAAAQRVNPVEQRFQTLPQLPRDVVPGPGLFRSTGAVATLTRARLPQVGFDERKVSVGWDNGVQSRFHHIWLRDHCRCSECLHPVTKQRLVNTFEIPPNVRPTGIESKPAGLEVTWTTSPQHVSLYPWEWLSRSSYDPPIRHSLAYGPTNKKTTWGSGIRQAPPTVTYEEVMRDDDGVYKWLQKIACRTKVFAQAEIDYVLQDEFGVCFISGVPPNPEGTEALTRRIAFIRDTKYGGFWDFTSDLKHGDTAYTNLALGAHTDTTYLSDPCGLQLFHLLAHEGTGGKTLLVDGFYAAAKLKEKHPSHYDLLTNVKISAHAAGDADSLYIPDEPFPILKTDLYGNLMRVRYNNDDRSALKFVDPDLVDDWYDALRSWNRCLTSSDAEFWVQLGAGTAVVVDNHRVLHGRSAFTGKRRMCGAYVGADEWKSRLRVLSQSIDKQPWDSDF